MRSKDEILDTIFKTPWHMMRWVRLIVGLLATGNFIYELRSNNLQTIDYLILALGFYFIYKGLFNTGCEVKPDAPHYDNKLEEETVEYTEIK